MQGRNGSYGEADDNARGLIKRTRRVMRRRFSPEEKVRIVIEGIRGEYRSVLCVGGKGSPPARSTSG